MVYPRVRWGGAGVSQRRHRFSDPSTAAGQRGAFGRAGAKGGAAGGVPAAGVMASDRSGFCAILTSTQVRCWGDNVFGSLGNGPATSVAKYPSSCTKSPRRLRRCSRTTGGACGSVRGTWTVAAASRTCSCTSTSMQPGKALAGIFSRRPLTAMPDPHAATAMASVGAVTFASSILPWRGAKGAPWSGDTQGERTERTVRELLDAMPSAELVWGGDFNHALDGPESGGCAPGQRAILAAIDQLQLRVHTIGIPHWIDGMLTIDHIATPRSSLLVGAERLPVRRHLSDHDAYVVEIA